MTERLRFSPDVLVRLGEELAPDVDQGIIELVKNAYDADATSCSISLHNAKHAGTIVVSDDGRGMTAETLRNGWLVIGRSSKREKTLTPHYGRVPAGDKGLGRLAALRLGHRVTVITRPAETPGLEYKLLIDWDAFDAAEVVEEVPIDLQTGASSLGSGTEIRIEGLKAPIGRGAMTKLARSLLLLADPFANDGTTETPAELPRTPAADGSEVKLDPGFRPSLDTPEFADLQKKVRQSYFADAEYRIQAILEETGGATFRLLDWKGDETEQSRASRNYDAPAFRFDLWVFILNSQSFSTRTSTLHEVREWLSIFGGVHIYEDGVRVPPYGGAGNDWLELNLKRARSPENRPSTNTSIGRVRVQNADRRLIQKTDRIGYVETKDFAELRACCQDALDWAALVLTRERDRKRRAELEEARRKTERTTDQLGKVLAKAVRPTDGKRVEEAIERYVKDAGQETKALREELQLYRSLATAGMTSAVFSHEIGRPLALIDSSLKALQAMIPPESQARASRRIERVAEAQKRLDSFISVPLSLLSKRKRRSGRISVNTCVAELVTLLEPIVAFFKARIELDLSKVYNEIHGSESLIDGICLNLVMNALKAFQRPGFDQADRCIQISTRLDGSDVMLVVRDNAGGIEGVELKDIWLPGVTSDPDGTGFGLTIVRDSVADLGGRVTASARTEFGGAEFVISIPVMRSLIH